MKTQQDVKKSGNIQGTAKPMEGVNNLREDKKQQGISNAGGQRSDQTSGKDSMHKPEHRKS